MKKKSSLNEGQYWQMAMTIIPIVILGNAGNELGIEGVSRVLISAILSGIGGSLGFATSYFVKDKSRMVKLLSTIGLTLFSLIPVFYFVSSESDLQHDDWITQKIGHIEFDAPSKLQKVNVSIPESAQWFYDELAIYSTTEDGRSISFIESTIKIDTLSVENAFSMALGGMLNKIDVDVSDIRLEVFFSDEEEVSSMFSVSLNGTKLNGYGYMLKLNNSLESIWLLPLDKGFSREYIEEFELGIITDYGIQ